MGKTLTIVLLFALLPGVAAQTREAVPPGMRTVSLFASVGMPDVASGGMCYQVDERYAVGIAVSGFVLKGGRGVFLRSATGVGLRAAYYLTPDGRDGFLWGNAIITDVHYLFPAGKGEAPSWDNPGGLGLELMFGRDAILGSGLGVLWGVGLAACFHSEAPPLLFPALRLGLHVDI